MKPHVSKEIARNAPGTLPMETIPVESNAQGTSQAINNSSALYLSITFLCLIVLALVMVSRKVSAPSARSRASSH